MKSKQIGQIIHDRGASEDILFRERSSKEEKIKNLQNLKIKSEDTDDPSRTFVEKSDPVKAPKVARAGVTTNSLMPLFKEIIIEDPASNDYNDPFYDPEPWDISKYPVAFFYLEKINEDGASAATDSYTINIISPLESFSPSTFYIREDGEKSGLSIYNTSSLPDPDDIIIMTAKAIVKHTDTVSVRFDGRPQTVKVNFYSKDPNSDFRYGFGGGEAPPSRLSLPYVNRQLGSAVYSFNIGKTATDEATGIDVEVDDRDDFNSSKSGWVFSKGGEEFTPGIGRFGSGFPSEVYNDGSDSLVKGPIKIYDEDLNDRKILNSVPGEDNYYPGIFSMSQKKPWHEPSVSETWYFQYGDGPLNPATVTYGGFTTPTSRRDLFLTSNDKPGGYSVYTITLIYDRNNSQGNQSRFTRKEL